MPIYMKIAGISSGPITYDKSKGWFELESIKLSITHDSSTSEQLDVVYIMRKRDAVSQDLDDLQARQTEGEATIVEVMSRKGSTEETMRAKLTGARILRNNPVIYVSGRSRVRKEEITLKFR